MERGTGLWIHDRAEAVERIPDAIAAALVRVFGEGEVTATAADVVTAGREMADLWASQRWIQCCCTDGLPALMFPRRRLCGRMELVQHSRYPHADACRLARTRRQVALEVGPPPGLFAIGKGEGADHAVLLLHALLEESGLNRVWPEDLRAQQPGWGVRLGDVNARYAKLRESLMTKTTLGGLSAYAACGGTRRAVSWIRRTVAARGRGAHRQAFFLHVVAQEELADRLQCNGVAFSGPSAIVGRSGDHPVMVLGCFETLDGGASWTDKALAGQALLSHGNLWPIFSEVDAELARMLMGQLLYWQSRGVRVGLEKPLRGVSAGWGTLRPPDFVLHLPDGGRVVIDGRSEGAGLAAEAIERQRRLESHGGVRSVLTVTGEIDRAWFRKATTATVFKAVGLVGTPARVQVGA